ncbi:hypothetical protein HK104_009303 [Borealophlyctis nickersoniae]|nr:hypothetical protein HK104_009303 [Borealophlyctis nickersoniae]
MPTHNSAVSRAHSSRPTLETIPRECLLLILSKLPAEALCTISATSKYLFTVASDSFLWTALCLRDYSTNPAPYLSTVSAFPFQTVKQCYAAFMRKWAPRLGVFQSDYSFYEGNLVIARPDFSKGCVGIYEIRGENALEDESEKLFSLDLSVSVDEFLLRVDSEKMFEVRFVKAEEVVGKAKDVYNELHYTLEETREADAEKFV